MRFLISISAIFTFIFMYYYIHITNAANCVDINYGSEEFRVSAGAYDVDTITPFFCQSLCKDGNFSYAALMEEKYCLCSYTSEDYDIDSKCCSTKSPSSCDSEQLLGMQVNGDDYLTIMINNLSVGGNAMGANVRFTIEGEATVEGIVRIYLNGELAEKPYSTGVPTHMKKTSFKGLSFPGTYTLKAEIVDSDTGSLRDVYETEFYYDENDSKYTLGCGGDQPKHELFWCYANLKRGENLTLEVMFEWYEEPITYIVPDVGALYYGPEVPRYWEPPMTYDPPAVVYLGFGKLLPFGQIVAFEYFSESLGEFKVKILAPLCEDDTEACSKCRRNCPMPNLIVCEEDEVFYSTISSCAKIGEEPLRAPVHKRRFNETYSLIIKATSTGYRYQNLEMANLIPVQPDYVIAIERMGSKHVLGYKPATDEDKTFGRVDTNDKGEPLNARFSIRLMVTSENEVYFSSNYSENGIYDMYTILHSRYGGSRVNSQIRIASYVRGLELSGGDVCVAIGEPVTLEGTLEDGTDVTVRWKLGDGRLWKKYTLRSYDDEIKETFRCSRSGNYTIQLFASNAYNYENVTTSFCCFHMISRDWEIETNSPQIVPPGNITLTLKFTGDEKKFPDNVLSDWLFGDEGSENTVPVESVQPVESIHSYKEAGIYTVTVKVYHNMDAEEFTTEVELLEKLGLLEIAPFYSMDGDPDLKDLDGPGNQDIPLESTAVFKCNITGSVEKYTISIESESFEESNGDGSFSYKFANVGEYEAQCVASNILETSNDVTASIRVLGETAGLDLVASKSSLSPHDDVEFTLSFTSSDEFTCYTFDPDDGGIKQAFGNEETCKHFVGEENMQYNPRGSERRVYTLGTEAMEETKETPRPRISLSQTIVKLSTAHSHRTRATAKQEIKRRETTEVSWIDDKTISIVHTYHSGGSFTPTAEAFNTFHKAEATTDIDVQFLATSIWIENNSTNVNYPMKFRRSETFRLETTALLVDYPGYSYKMIWNVSEIEKSGDIIRDIDVSDIVSSKVSAIRFPKRYLTVGLYHILYSIEIYDNETFNETLSCFTYLEIINTPLRPMIIRGGDSYILRGYKQEVALEPSIYSIDPDDPEEKNFEIEWSCQHYDPHKFLDEDEEYDSITSLSMKGITWTKSRETDSTENCFTGNKDAEILQGPNVQFSTADLLLDQTLYKIEAKVSKDTRKTVAKIFLDIIPDNPPSILIMCEHPVACIPTGEGFLVNPSSRLSVRAECVADCDPEKMLYNWEIYAIDEEKSEKILLEEWNDFAIVDEDRLGIYKSFFLKYQEYVSFHIQVSGESTDKERPKGVAKLYIIINKPPTPGTCLIDSNTGVAMISIFHMEFGDWTDPEEHEITDYSIYMNYEGYLFRIHYGVKTSVDFILPPGDSEIMCVVEDELGARATISVETVTATMPEKSQTDLWKNVTNVDFFAVEGKMSVLAQAVTAEAFVDRNQREDDYESISEEVERVWLAYLELPGIDSSYYTKEAREEIEAEVRDNRAGHKDAEAAINLEMFRSIEILPLEVLQDAEVYGQAVSALAETRPLNRESKILLNTFIADMFTATENGDAGHSEDKEVAFMLIGNSMNCLSETLSEEVIGGNYLESELEGVYEFLSFNITQPNFFILYVDGSRWEVAERVRQTKVDGVKNVTQFEIDDQINNLKNITKQITSELIKDVMVGEDPLTVSTMSGLQIKTEKRHVANMSGETMESEGSFIKLPDACILVGKSLGCEQNGSLGMVSVKWSSILEVGGTEHVDLSPESSTLEFSLTNRDGDKKLVIKDAEEPFEICLSISPVSEENDRKKKFVLPNFDSNDDFLVYHQLTVDKEGSAVKVDMILGENAKDYVLFYGVGFKPALRVYDGRVFLKDFEDIEGSYSVLFSLDKQDPSPGDLFYLAVGHLVNITSKKWEQLSSGANLTRDDMTNDFIVGYSIALYTTGCYYYSEETSMWSSGGCKVHSARDSMICCHCNHLTMFGSGFLVAPNIIDFEYVFANAGFNDNFVIYLTLIITFSLFIILLIWARWKDKKDLKKIGATPLLDNDVQDKYFYEIVVQTGYQMSASTKSKVHFIISGEDDETDVRTLTDDQRSIFERGAVDVFIMSVPRCLGQLNYLRVWHDNSGKGKHASWYLKHIVVKDIFTGYKYEFIAEKWLAVEEGDGQIDYLLPVAGKEQTTEFSHLFPSASQRSLTDNHLWLSIFTRPARSRFTRVQRLCCCFAMLYLSMLTSAMWYERTPEQPSPGAFKFGPLSLSPEQVAVGLMSNLIVFPPTFLMIFFFRKSRARNLRPSHVNVALHQQYERWKKSYGGEKGKTNPGDNTNRRRDEEALELNVRRKKKLHFPWWCVFISWILVVGSVGCSIFFLWAYGLQFGHERTVKWLTSLVISFCSSVLLTEPIKIFCLAIVMACLCGNPDVDEDDADDDEEDPYLKKDEQWLHDINPGMSVQRPKYRPIDQQSLEAARKMREKELKMYSVLKEIGIYALYLWILMVLSYGNRDPNNYYIREAFINGFIKPGDLWVDFNTITTENRFWNWTREALIPELFAGEWYNKRVPLGLRLLLDDRNNFKVGYPVLRQVRAAKNVCKVPWQMQDLIPECAGFGNLINEDDVYYKEYWRGNLTMASRVPQEYKYLSASQLNGFPFWGQIDWYGGGGYVVPLIAKRYKDGAKLIERMIHLERTGWIDKDTRAVFIEFGTYNAQVNLFVVVTIVAEFLPGGGIIPYYHIDPIKLLHYHTGSGLLQLTVQIGFVLFSIYYTVCVLMDFGKQGRKYFSQYWNIAELANLMAAYSIITVEIYKMIITQQILKKFTATEGTGYIKLQEALILDECFCYLIGFLMSLATLKFIKLLRFNKRIGSMITTVRECAKELKGYSICLLITFFAFVTLFWLVLGRAVKEFSSFVYSFESSISMMLKKFNYEDIQVASPIVGPIAFFTFALMASIVLVNILLTIIIQTFEEVRVDDMTQSGDYQLVSFMIARLKLFLGLKKNKIQAKPVVLTTEKQKENSVVDSFSGKVDKLLDFINSVYLDERVDIDLLKKANFQGLVTASEENLEKKKSRPRKIPRYQSRHMKQHLDF